VTEVRGYLLPAASRSGVPPSAPRSGAPRTGTPATTGAATTTADGLIGATLARADGTFFLTVAVPAGTPSGTWALQVNGLAPDGQVRSVTADLVVAPVRRTQERVLTGAGLPGSPARLRSESDAVAPLLAAIPDDAAAVVIRCLGLADGATGLRAARRWAAAVCSRLAADLPAARTHHAGRALPGTPPGLRVRVRISYQPA